MSARGFAEGVGDPRAPSGAIEPKYCHKYLRPRYFMNFL